MLSKNIAKGLLAATLIAPVLFSAKPAQGASASATGTANATIVAPITLAVGVTMEFGQLAAGTGGTAVLDTAGAVTATGNVTALAGSTTRAATFTVGGLTDATYAITLPASATLNGGGSSMTVDTFQCVPTSIGAVSPVGKLLGGSDTLTIGATLRVANSQAPGAYTGTYSVSVAYN